MDRVKVIKDNEIVGYCFWDNNKGITKFDYAQDFVKKGEELSPIVMPLHKKTFISSPRPEDETFKNLPPLLADALPDSFGNKLINEWFLKRNIKQGDLNPVERLAFLANRGMGALEFQPIIESPRADGLIKVADLLDVVNAIYFRKEDVSEPLNDYQQGLETLIHIGSSAGGARAKALLAINEKTNEIKAGDINQGEGFEYYLIKFDGLKDGKIIEPGGYGIVEYTYYEIAKMSGVDMTDCQLYQENGRSHFMTKRFDRNIDNSKNHIQTVCGLTGIDFNQQGNFSYEQLHRLTQMLTRSQMEVEKMFRRMVFNTIGMNNDDHLKNFSFMIKDGKWQLTPAYDMTFSYAPNHHWLKRHSIFLNEKLTDFNLKDIMQVAEDFNIKNADEIVRQTIESFEKFPALAKKNRLDTQKIKAINNCLIDNMEMGKFYDITLGKGKKI